MERHTYIQTLQSAAYELLGLSSEWTTDDGEYVDDDVNDELQAITFSLADFIQKLKERAETVRAE